ncbi:FmdB family zinc ribbon protein [Spirochaeta dissipatitropha]
MPSYDYECTACGYQFEEFQAMSDPLLTDCPSCGESTLKRLIGGGLGVIFKGSGFYVNDNRSAKNGAGSSSGESSSGSTSKTAAGTASTASSSSASSSVP